MSELIVLTCASGKQCTQIIPLLYPRSSQYKLRLVVHSKQSLERLTQQYPKAEVLQANLGSPDDCSRILSGATAIYYVSPTMNPHETHYGTNVIDAAVAESRKPGSSFAHFVFSSVIHPIISKLLNHDRKRLIEEYLTESALPYTVLQPGHFADNSIGKLVEQKDSANPVFRAPHSPESAFSFSTVHDHAEVSVKVIQERAKHYYATYQVVSTRPMTYREYVRSVGDEMGKTIEVEQMPYEEVVDLYCGRILGPDGAKEQSRRDGVERLLLYYNSRGLPGNPGILEWLLGRPGTTPAQLARMLLDAPK